MAGAGNNLYSNIASGVQSAGQGLNNAMNYTPQQISNVPQVGTSQVGANNVTAGNINTPMVSDADMSTYMNPYTSAVYDQSLNQLDQARQMAMTQGSDQAQMAGAFGGSRHGVADAQTNRAFADQAGQLASNLNNQNFQQAMQAAQFDTGNQFQGNMQNVSNALQAGLANQGANLQAGMANASNALSASGQNAGNNLAMQRANQQAGLQGNQQSIGAGQAMGGLANMGFGMGQQLQNQQAQQGAQQQAMMQQLINAGMGQYGGFTGSPGQSLQYPLSALGVSPVPQTTTNSMQPGLFNYLTLGAMM